MSLGEEGRIGCRGEAQIAEERSDEGGGLRFGRGGLRQPSAPCGVRTVRPVSIQRVDVALPISLCQTTRAGTWRPTSIRMLPLDKS
jgi:hypothetical protein